MKSYDSPKMSIIRLNTTDIIRTSPGDNEGCVDENGLPIEICPTTNPTGASYSHAL